MRPYSHKLNQEKIDYFLADLYNKLRSRKMENNYDLTKLLDTMSEVTNQYFPRKKISRKQYKIANTVFCGLSRYSQSHQIERYIICQTFEGKKFSLLLQPQKFTNK